VIDHAAVEQVIDVELVILKENIAMDQTRKAVDVMNLPVIHLAHIMFFILIIIVFGRLGVVGAVVHLYQIMTADKAQVEVKKAVSDIVYEKM